MSSQSNANSEIKKFDREARKIDELFDSIHIDLVLIDRKSNKNFVSEWKNLKKTWREVLQESRDEISGLDNFMQSFANVELPFLQDINHTIQEKLNSLKNYILEAKSNRSKAEGVRKKFDKLCDSVKTFLASRGFNEIQVYCNVTIKTLYEALSEWAIAFKNFASSSLCQIFKGELKEKTQKNISEQIRLGTYQGLRRSRNTTDDGELKKATRKLWNQIASCFSNQVKQKETKESEKVEKNTRELGNTIKFFSNTWGEFSSDIQKIKTNLERIGQPVVNNDFDSGLFQRQLEYACNAMKPHKKNLGLYARNIDCVTTQWHQKNSYF